MKATWIALLAGGVLMHSFAFADVTYHETTQVTGGSMMGMLKMAGALSSQARQLSAPVTSTVMIQGGRMVSVNPHTTVIIDLDQQNMTTIDHDKRTYSVVTFQEIQEQMKKMAAQTKGAKTPSGDGSQMSFSAHISSTGASRQIDGQTAQESLLTVTMTSNAGDNNTKAGMAATSELWIVKEEPGMDEMRRFNQRMASELDFDLAGSAMSSLLATQPGGAQALAELKKESGKVSGLPVLQVTRVGITPDGQPLPAPSAAPLAPNQQAGSSSTAGNVTQEVAAGTATQEAGSQISRLGTFGRALGSSSMGALMHHAPSPSSAPSQPSAAANPATAGVLLENQTQLSGFSTASVDASRFQVPAGYKAVASPMAAK